MERVDQALFPLRNAAPGVAGVVVEVARLVADGLICLGVHFPLDILGAALVGLGGARLVRGQEARLIAPQMRRLLG